MTEILSQEEIDTLLSAISSGEVSSEDYSSAGEQRKVKIYDFKRPDKFSKDQEEITNRTHMAVIAGGTIIWLMMDLIKWIMK